jgi:hypothetical protein
MVILLERVLKKSREGGVVIYLYRLWAKGPFGAANYEADAI